MIIKKTIRPFMKTIRLSTLLVGAIMFLGSGFTTASAEGMKCGASMKASKVKTEDVNKSIEVYGLKEWNIKRPNEGYKRGEISTH
jgi:hypothetical protein